MMPELGANYKKGLSLPFDSLKLVRREIAQTKGWPVSPTLKAHLERIMPKYLPSDISYSFMIGDHGETCHWFCHQKSGKYLRL